MLTFSGLFILLAVGIFCGWMSRLIGWGRDFGLGRDLLVGFLGALLGWIFAFAANMHAFGSQGFLFMAFLGSIATLFIFRFALGSFA